MPQEEEKFREFSVPVQTKSGTIRVLKQTDKGKCIFYDELKNGCTIYDTRPFDCRMFPYVVSYAHDKVIYKLDDKYCPRIVDCTHDEVEEDKAKWIAQNLPVNWVMSYAERD